MYIGIFDEWSLAFWQTFLLSQWKWAFCLGIRDALVPSFSLFPSENPGFQTPTKMAHSTLCIDLLFFASWCSKPFHINSWKAGWNRSSVSGSVFCISSFVAVANTWWKSRNGERVQSAMAGKPWKWKLDSHDHVASGCQEEKSISTETSSPLLFSGEPQPTNSITHT